MVETRNDRGSGRRHNGGTAMLGATAGCKGVAKLGAEALGAAALGEVALGVAALAIVSGVVGSRKARAYGRHFSRISMQSSTSSACFVYACNAFALRAYREGAECQTEPKHSSECCDIQQLEGEAHDKSKWVTSVSNGYKTCSHHKQASVHRAYIRAQRGIKPP
jgi:hypothetical protein